jgi:hypothetical protein
MEVGHNKALTGKMRGEEDGIFVKRVTTTKGCVSTANMTQIPDRSLIYQLYWKSGSKILVLK